MKTYIVSDLHLSDGGKADDFKPHEKAFIRFLDEVVGDDHLIIAGDFLDLWKANYFEILKAYFPLIKKIHNKNTVILSGNHDQKMSFIWIFKEWSKQGWFIIHGHQLDRTLDDKPERILARIACWLSDKFQNVFPWVAKLEYWLLTGHRRNEPYIKKIRERYPGQRVIFGHSHTPAFYWGGGLSNGIINTGSWGIDQPKHTYVVIHEDGEAELKEFE